MGNSPSADLYYGYDLGDLTDHKTWADLRPDWMQDDEHDAEEELAKVLGWVQIPFPDHLFEYPEGMRYPERQEWDRDARLKPEYLAYSKNRDEMRGKIRDYAIELDTYGGASVGGDTMYCVRVKASVQRADDWGSTELKPLNVEEGWNGQLHAYMEMLSLPIPVDKEPGWHMNCSYG